MKREKEREKERERERERERDNTNTYDHFFSIYTRMFIFSWLIHSTSTHTFISSFEKKKMLILTL